MLKLIKPVLFIFLVAGFFASCKSDGDSAREQTVLSADATTDAAAAAAGTPGAPATPGQTVTPVANDPAATPAAPVGPTTSMTFDETVFDYGKVKAGEKVRHEYKFKNTGKEPLILSNCKGSCGCTVPECPKEPIPVGGTGKIMVEFDSKGKAGPQSKQVTVTANTEPAQSFLTIKGEVIGDPAQAQPATPATGAQPAKQ